jgi:malonyl-CoA O-methyltransferase
MHDDEVRRVFDRAADTYDAAAILQCEIGKRLLERLDYLRIDPSVIVDLGTGTGQALDDLRVRYPSARVVGIDISEDMLQRARKRGRWFRRPLVIAANATSLPLMDNSVDLIYSNLMLPWCSHPDDVWSEVSRVLRPGGALLCTTLGPDTLLELRAALSVLDPGGIHVHAFFDMHDIGDALIRHRIAEPVMDVEKLRVNYSSLDDLIGDLRHTGSTNIVAERRRGPYRRLTLNAIASHYPDIDDRGRFSATVEVVYGHGWATTDKPAGSAGTTTLIPVHSLQRR